MTNIQENIAGKDIERKPPEHNPIKRFYASPSFLKAIHAKCAECVGCEASEQGYGHDDHLERGWRDHIANCSSYTCPLRIYRPFQEKAA